MSQSAIVSSLSNSAAVILREVRLGGCNAPFVGSFVGFKLACKDLEQRGLCQLVAADKCDLVVVTNDKGDIV